MKIDLLVESSDGIDDAARGIRALQDFLNRPELGISGSRLSKDSGDGHKGFDLGALSVLFDTGVLAPLAELLKAFMGRNHSLTLKFPGPNGDVSITSENVSVDQLKELLKTASQFSRHG